jgi:hypothetical protein
MLAADAPAAPSVVERVAEALRSGKQALENSLEDLMKQSIWLAVPKRKVNRANLSAGRSPLLASGSSRLTCARLGLRPHDSVYLGGGFDVTMAGKRWLGLVCMGS